jgi:hypothetical protein
MAIYTLDTGSNLLGTGIYLSLSLTRGTKTFPQTYIRKFLSGREKDRGELDGRGMGYFSGKVYYRTFSNSSVDLIPLEELTPRKGIQVLMKLLRWIGYRPSTGGAQYILVKEYRRGAPLLLLAQGASGAPLVLADYK